MATFDDLARAIIEMEGSEKPGSVGYSITQKYGMYNLGHLVWAGQTGAVAVVVNNRQWAAWPTWQAAYDGLIRQIRLDASRGLTLSQFIAKYAPPKENNTSAYLEFVKGKLGAASGTLLSSLGPASANPTQAPPAPKTPAPVGQVRVAVKGPTSSRSRVCPACGQTLPLDSKISATPSPAGPSPRK